jgi:L-lactate dehydrogenase
MQIPEGQTTRIAVVGTGHVGATFAYALLLSGLAAEIVLLNRTREKAEGEAMDLRHAEPFTHRTRIWTGDFSDLKGAAVTVVLAGAPQKKGET